LGAVGPYDTNYGQIRKKFRVFEGFIGDLMDYL
jgi:hypothetical protein